MTVAMARSGCACPLGISPRGTRARQMPGARVWAASRSTPAPLSHCWRARRGCRAPGFTAPQLEPFEVQHVTVRRIGATPVAKAGALTKDGRCRTSPQKTLSVEEDEHDISHRQSAVERSRSVRFTVGTRPDLSRENHLRHRSLRGRRPDRYRGTLDCPVHGQHLEAAVDHRERWRCRRHDRRGACGQSSSRRLHPVPAPHRPVHRAVALPKAELRRRQQLRDHRLDHRRSDDPGGAR